MKAIHNGEMHNRILLRQTLHHKTDSSIVKPCVLVATNVSRFEIEKLQHPELLSSHKNLDGRHYTNTTKEHSLSAV